MNAETIKDFLVSLGFDVDEAGSAKFEAVIAGVTDKAIKMGVAVEASALAVVAFTAKIASGLDKLYWASQRTGATVQGIQQIGYAVSQVGGNAEAAQGSLENLSRFMRNSPGAEGFLNRLGVQTRDANGNMRDMASVFTSVGQKLTNMPYFRANQYAQMLGIDENTLMAMRRGIGQFSAQYSQMARAIGYNADQAAVSSNKFTTSLSAFSQMAGMARDKIGSNLAEGLAGSIDNLRKLVLDNFPKIEEMLTRGVKGILWLAEVIGRVIFRFVQAAGEIIEWWRSLDKSTQQLIATFGALLVAWRVLNSAFLASPIGRIIALIGSLALLYDDYKTWKEGGQSLIDWQKWEPGIQYAKKAIGSLGGDFGELLNKVKSLGEAFGEAFLKLLRLINIDTSKFNGKWLFDQIIESVRSSIKMVGSLVDVLRKLISGDFDGAWESIKELAKTGVDSPIGKGVAAVGSGLYTTLNNKLNEHLPEWAGGTPAQSSQPVKRPQPTSDGAITLGWLQPTLARLEQLYRLPEGLLRSVAITESSGNPNAVSPVGAQGLFQIMPATGRDLGLRDNDAFDPVKSAQAAAKYLSQLIRANNGDLSKALASYNWGIGNVQKHGMALMPRETREYIPKVMSNMPGQGANIQQETTINIHGVSDPRSAASEIASRQTGVNSQLAQSLVMRPK